MHLMTTRQVSAHYGVCPSRIRQIVMRDGLRPAMVAGRLHLWDREQLPKLCPRADGRRTRSAGRRGYSRT